MGKGKRLRDRKATELVQREIADEVIATESDRINEKVEAVFDDKKFSSTTNKIVAAVRWLITIAIGSLLLYILSDFTAAIAVQLITRRLHEANMLSQTAQIASATAFSTSMLWAIIIKWKFFERLYQFFKKVIPDFKTKGDN